MLKSLPIDIIKQYGTYANNVYNCAIRNQSNVFILHGPQSEQSHKEKLPHLNETFSEQNYYVPSKGMIHLHFNANDSSTSVVLNGLCQNTIIICNKVNHILMRRCSNVKVYIKKGTISGLDILKSYQIYVKMPSHNYTNIEYGEKIDFQADTDITSLLSVVGSLDVTSNGYSLPVNPFNSINITEKGIFQKKSGEFPAVCVCK